MKTNRSPTRCANRTVSVSVGITGKDVFATDSGNSWMALLKTVEQKLRRQHEKRKSYLQWQMIHNVFKYEA